MINTSTYSDKENKPITIDDLRKMADLITKKEEKQLPKGLGWFTRLMARFGWHRKYEIIIFDKSKFKPQYPYFPKVENK